MKGQILDHHERVSFVKKEATFECFGSNVPSTPLIISVPHAGRAYQSINLKQFRVEPHVLQRLEDRYADKLAAGLIERGMTVVVAHTPRAIIDINRHPREIDDGMVDDMPHNMALQSSAKLRGGLGLIPRRLYGVGDLLHDRLPWHEVKARIDHIHEPYHHKIGQLMRQARDNFGHAILLDLHSMPSLPREGTHLAPQLVIGDRFGRSCPSLLSSIAMAGGERHGINVSHNRPYAGDYMLERHGRPISGLFALQLEVDRGLYLDGDLNDIGAGLAKITSMITDIGLTLAEAIPRQPVSLAAE